MVYLRVMQCSIVSYDNNRSSSLLTISVVIRGILKNLISLLELIYYPCNIEMSSKMVLATEKLFSFDVVTIQQKHLSQFLSALFCVELCLMLAMKAYCLIFCQVKASSLDKCIISFRYQVQMKVILIMVRKYCCSNLESINRYAIS